MNSHMQKDQISLKSLLNSRIFVWFAAGVLLLLISATLLLNWLQISIYSSNEPLIEISGTDLVQAKHLDQMEQYYKSKIGKIEKQMAEAEGDLDEIAYLQKRLDREKTILHSVVREQFVNFFKHSYGNLPQFVGAEIAVAEAIPIDEWERRKKKPDFEAPLTGTIYKNYFFPQPRPNVIYVCQDPETGESTASHFTPNEPQETSPDDTPLEDHSQKEISQPTNSAETETVEPPEAIDQTPTETDLSEPPPTEPSYEIDQQSLDMVTQVRLELRSLIDEDPDTESDYSVNRVFLEHFLKDKDLTESDLENIIETEFDKQIDKITPDRIEMQLQNEILDRQRTRSVPNTQRQ